MQTRKVVGRGRTAEVLAWGGTRVLKLFYPHAGADNAAAREYRSSRWVFQRGLPVPAVDGTVSICGRPGIVYERLQGRSMLHQLIEHPDQAGELAFALAQLQAEVNSVRVTEAPLLRVREKLLAAVNAVVTSGLVPADMQPALLRRTRQLPDGDRLCHGDFHPDNVILHQDGPKIIDWADAGLGSPLLDTARTVFLLRFAAAPEAEKVGIAAMRAEFSCLYLRRYLELVPEASDWKSWLPVVAAARLHEGIAAEREELLALIHRLL